MFPLYEFCAAELARKPKRPKKLKEVNYTLLQSKSKAKPSASLSRRCSLLATVVTTLQGDEPVAAAAPSLLNELKTFWADLLVHVVACLHLRALSSLEVFLEFRRPKVISLYAKAAAKFVESMTSWQGKHIEQLSR